LMILRLGICFFILSLFLCMPLSMYSLISLSPSLSLYIAHSLSWIFLERDKIMENARSFICGMDGEWMNDGC
jgi:hypothetical protein